MLQDQINAAQVEFDAAKAKLAQLQAQLEAAQPHLSVLAEIESFADRVSQDARNDFAALIAKAKGLF